MTVYVARKGLELPIDGEPEQVLGEAPEPRRVAILGGDYVGLKPRLLVREGDRVALGQPVIEDRVGEGIPFVAPAAGRVAGIHRGAKRRFLSLVIEVEGDEVVPLSYEGADDSREKAIALLVASGLWTAFRTRPFSRTPLPATTPHSIFVTVVDSHPLAPRPELAIEGREEDLERGFAVLRRLTDGPVHLCIGEDSSIGAGDSGAQISRFAGKHPYGTVGYHIHMLDPVHRDKTVWHIGYQDVLRVGRLFAAGHLDTTQVVSLAGPMVKRPRVLRTRLGAEMASLTEGELADGEVRVISGSVLSGQRAMGPAFGYLGRFACQVSVIAEGRERAFLGWTAPGRDRFSVIPTFLSSLLPRRRFSLNTNTNGSRRAMVPINVYERVMPMDLMVTHLLRAIAVEDPEWAEELGVLELDEEDVSLCTFVCPSKIDYGPALRRTLDAIEKEQ